MHHTSEGASLKDLKCCLLHEVSVAMNTWLWVVDMRYQRMISMERSGTWRVVYLCQCAWHRSIFKLVDESVQRIREDDAKA